MRIVAALGISLLLLALGCQQGAEIYVECKGAADGVSCDVTHRKGKSAGKACWDVVLNCENGAALKARACETVAPEEVKTVTIPESEFGDLSACDQPSGMEVTNMKVMAE